jgi:aspartate--ammonia ligase
MKDDILKTEKAIRFVKQTFSTLLADALDLEPVSSPLAVADGTGINDDLNGIEKPVSFTVKEIKSKNMVVVQSLAKWKRVRLMELGIESGKGILTDMRALRPDETFSPIHSIYVDQWDWEKHIEANQRTIPYLKETVKKIYKALRDTELRICEAFPQHSPFLPPQITFIHSEDLAKRYPLLNPKERETEACLEHGAIFVIGIGGKLGDGKRHDGRAPDYDDWSTPTINGYSGLNGDIIVWNPLLEMPFEISSMGIRVDGISLKRQLTELGCSERENLQFHRMLLDGKLPLSIGGGIGQSRVCMLLLRKIHIGEVQVGVWSDAVREKAVSDGITLL